MSHFVNVCEHGRVHGQCKCPGPKDTRRVTCDIPSHAGEPPHEPKHRADGPPRSKAWPPANLEQKNT